MGMRPEMDTCASCRRLRVLQMPDLMLVEPLAYRLARVCLAAALLIAVAACASFHGGRPAQASPPVAATPTSVADAAVVSADGPMPSAMDGTADDAIPAAISQGADGSMLRIRLVRASGKYALLRREETLVRRAQGIEVASVREMVADHVLVSLGRRQAAEVAAATGCTVRRILHGGATALLAFEYRAHADFEANRGRIASVAGVRAAEPDWIVHAIGTPDDPGFAQLWGMSNDGDHDIDAPEAWDIHTGSSAVLVGVIDTGIDDAHPDLAANMWRNTGEYGPDGQGNPKQSNGIDDDGNGFIDDWRGWDFVNEDNDPSDDHYHGTHCAGTIGAVGGNGIGVAGVCWNVSMVGLKFLSSYGSGAISDAVEAQLYANAIGCTLTSNSWGGGGYSQAMKDAIDAAGAQGSLFVAAAGNSAVNNDVYPHYPSSYDSANLIAVAATDSSDAQAYFSCWGPTSVDLAAPGVSIYSCQPGGLYQYLSGTSMATPHVAGACALLKSVNPSLTGLQIRQTILDHVDAIPSMSGKCVTGGRLNLYAAIQSVSGPVIALSGVSIAESGDGDGLLNPGEAAILTVTLASVGSEAVAGLQATITTSDPAVQIEQGTAVFGDLAPGQSANGDAPYRIRLAADASTPHAVALTLTAGAGASSWVFNLPVEFVTTTRISGTVSRQASGVPISGATVWWSGAVSGSATSGADGAFAMVVPAGSYQVRAEAAGLNPGSAVAVTVPPDAVLDLQLGAAGMLVSPTEVDLTTDQPVASVTIANPGDAPLAFAITSSTEAITSGLWHTTSYRTASGSGTSWYYGDEAKRNFDTGGRTSGALAFPSVAVPIDDPILRFSSWRSVEYGIAWDQSLVQVSSDAGQSWMTVAAPAAQMARRDGIAEAQVVAPAGTWTTLRQETDNSLSWYDVSVDLSAYAGQSIAVRFWFDSIDGVFNSTEGWYVDAIRIGQIKMEPWLTCSPASGIVPPGASADLQIQANASAVPAGAYEGTVFVAGDVPGGAMVPVQVSFVREIQPELVLTNAAWTDAVAPALGDGDSVAEPGETIALSPTWKNQGTITASGAVAALSSTSPYVQITAGTSALPVIPGGESAIPEQPFVLTILSDCPNYTSIPLHYSATLPNGITTSADTTLLVHWSSRLSGTVHDGLGQPVAGAIISIAGIVTTSGADGSYGFTGVPAGTHAASASKPGALTAQTQITTPPDATWDPLLGTPGFTSPAGPLQLSAVPGSNGSTTITLGNPGDIATEFTVAAQTSFPAATGLWHSTSYRTVGGQPVWYYGVEAQRNYDTGGSNSGMLTFANVAVPLDDPTLSWQQWRETEGSYYSDASLIQVSTDGDYWSTVHQTYENDAAWHTVAASLAGYAGQNVQIRFWFDTRGSYGNAYEGWYVGDLRIGGQSVGADWLQTSLLSGTIPPGGSIDLDVIATADAQMGGSYQGSLVFITTAPADPKVSVPVLFTVVTPAQLDSGTPTVIDTGDVPIVGDGDGTAEPGETIAWSVPLRNRGTTAAVDVTATLSSSSPYVTFPVATAVYATVPGLGTSLPAAPFAISIDPDCPDGAIIAVACSMTAAEGGPWNSTLELQVTWNCRVQGVVTQYGTGAPLEGAYVSCQGWWQVTASDGSYCITGLKPGSGTVNVWCWNYESASTTVTLPPDAVFSPVLGKRSLTVSPDPVSLTLQRGSSASQAITLTSTGSLPSQWEVASNWYPWLALSPTQGAVPAGDEASAELTVSADGMANGYYYGYLPLLTDSTDSIYKYITVYLTVRSANPPVASPVQATVPEDGSAQFQLLGTDADGDDLTYEILTQPQHGTVALGGGGEVTYVPTKLFHGADSFTYAVSDGMDQSQPATVSIDVTHVNHQPQAWFSVVRIAPGGEASFALPCSDVDGDTLTTRIASPARVGIVACAGTTATYQPADGFTGQDLFTFAASDGQVESPVVQVLVVVGGDAVADGWPTLGNGPAHLGYVPRELGTMVMLPLWTATTPAYIHQVAVGDGRVYYTTQSYFGVMQAAAVDPYAGQVLWTRTFNPGFALNPPTFADGSIYLQRGNHGGDSQLWRLSAASGATEWSAPYDEQWERHLAPTVDGDRVWVNGGYYGGMYGFSRTTGAQAFFAYKPQVDGWTPTLSGGVLYAWAGGQLAAHDPQGGAMQWSVSPEGGYYGYGQCGAAVADASRVYVIYNGACIALDLATHQIAWSTTGSFLGIPSLHDGVLFAYSSTGIAQLDAATGAMQLIYPCASLYPSLQYSQQPIVTPDAVIASGAEGTYLFARGDTTLQASAPVGGHISLAGSRLYIAGSDLRAYRIGNHAPTAVARSAEMQQEGIIGLSLWGADIDDDPLSWSLVTAPAHGSATIADGRLTYAPEAGFSGIEEFTVAASDGFTVSEPALVRITVLPTPNVPVATPLHLVVRQGQQVAITLQGSSPIDGELTYAIVQAPASGSLAGTAPNLLFTAAAGAGGDITFSYTVTNAAATSAPALVTITVTPDLPAGWISTAIGGGQMGQAWQDPLSGTLFISGSGKGPVGRRESGQLAATAVAGDFDIVACVPPPATTVAAARVGIVVRENADAGSRGVFLGLSGASQALCIGQTRAGATPGTTSWKASGPTWFRIRRRGNVLWCQRSNDGETWIPSGTLTIPLPDAVQAGVLVSSGSTVSQLAAQVEGLSITGPDATAPADLAINFQPGKDAAPVSDDVQWLIADGAPFGARWCGASYGFSVASTATYNRNSRLSLDERYDTGINPALGNAFEVALPAGLYTVTVCVGDAQGGTGRLHPEVEGVRVVTGIVKPSRRWFTGTIDVEVLDGRLTLRCGSGASVARWGWVLIQPQPVATPGDG